MARDKLKLASRVRSQVAHRPGMEFLVVMLALFAGILRFFHLASKSFWLDEGGTAHRVAMPLVPLIASALNMYLYFVVVHGWQLVAGASEFMLRFPSAIFATAAVPLIYALGVELGVPNAGLMGALFVTVNATCIQYAQTARSYALLVLLVLLSSLLFLRSIRRASFGNCAAYVITGVSGVYTHLFAIFTPVSQLPSLFIFRPERRLPSD